MIAAARIADQAHEDGPVYRGAVRIDGEPERYLVTYRAGLRRAFDRSAPDQQVIARVTRYEGRTFIDWVDGDIPDALADEAVRYGLAMELDAARGTAGAA